MFDFRDNATICYANGSMISNLVGVVGCGDGIGIGFGNRPNAAASPLNGQYDEIRLRGGTLSADRIKADYDMIANKNFCTYLVVKEGVEE